ncbi:hypothetical protein QT381_15055 [Galbitalea sp. SE-J8]|uniref:hypothetical protein n=1 Tax=Galbitalea sp. SE-J8 TaxID=3054952 RepID=UPI00259D255D|nr:hypothetical protein [Galbitalea sp. SE-J8]MDM4764322.1 hypothetical protein [Galbitalea sp. SE-J8]
MTETVTTEADAVALAGRILAPRTRPLVVLSTDPRTGEFVLDAERLADELSDLADVVLIATGDLTRTLDAHVPDRTQVYGGAGRSYPVDFGADPRWQRSPLRFPGARATDQLIRDALGQAHAAGVVLQPTGERSRPVAGTVLRFVGPERALVSVDDGLPVTLARELSYPPFPLEWLLTEGQPIAGTLEPRTRRLLLDRPGVAVADLRRAFPHGSTTLAFVKSVSAQRATLHLHPEVEHSVLPTDVSSNPLDTLDLLLAEGDVVRVRVLHLPDGSIRLTLLDVDDDEPVVPPLAVVAGGPPWLREGRPLTTPEEDEDDDLAGFEDAPAATPADPRTPSSPPAGDARKERPAAAHPRALPGPGLRPATSAPRVREAPRSETPAPPAPPAPARPLKASSALLSTQLQLDTARARIAELEARLARLDETDAALARLRAHARGTDERLRQERAERGELERRVREDEAQRRSITRELRKARAASASVAVENTRDERRALWLGDKEWLEHEIYLAWVERVAAPDRTQWALHHYVIGPEFAASLQKLDETQFRKAMKAVVDVVTGRIREIAGREAHPLRTGDGPSDPDTVRASDGAKCWRAYIEQKTPSARRLHYWVLLGGGIELSRVVAHDDVQP